MSVGGIIVEILEIAKDKLWINTCDKGEHCAVLCNPKENELKIGDSFWWQGDKCYWTPRYTFKDIRPRLESSDIELIKLGFSGAAKPSGLKEQPIYYLAIQEDNTLKIISQEKNTLFNIQQHKVHILDRSKYIIGHNELNFEGLEFGFIDKFWDFSIGNWVEFVPMGTVPIKEL